MHEWSANRKPSRSGWFSAWYAPAFGVAYGIEWLVWRGSPFVTAGFYALLAFSVVVALFPWIGSHHPEIAAALRPLGRRLWFVVPALLLHAAAIAFYGPYWRSGPSTSGTHAGEIVYALVSDTAMAKLVVGAVRNEDARDLAFLLRLGADPNVPDAGGAHPIDEAADAERLRMLVEHGARFAPGTSVRSLARAAQRGDAAMVREQLAAGADANAAGTEGWRALHVAAHMNHTGVIKVLLASGADPRLRNDRGETALDVANRWESHAAAQLLSRAAP